MITKLKAITDSLIKSNPFCMKKTLLEKEEIHRQQIDSIKHNHIKTLQETRRDVKELVQKLTTVKLSPSEIGDKFRICIDLSADMVYGSLSHGDDKEWIEYYAGYIASMVERELSGINAKRHDPDLFRRGY